MTYWSMKRYLTILFFFFLFIFPVFSQNWPKTFLRPTSIELLGMNKMYDKGFMLINQVESSANFPQIHSWLIKTDINGNLLWSKTFGSPSYLAAYLGMDATADGGLILTGDINKEDTEAIDILYSKLNSCGEKEWCNIISTPGIYDYGTKIRAISDGSFIAMNEYYQGPENRIWLFKIDPSGNILWEQLINRSNDTVSNAESEDFTISTYGGYVVTGSGYDIQEGGWLRPLFIKTDAEGDVQWTMLFGHNDGFRSGGAGTPQENTSGFIYAGSNHYLDTIPFGEPSCLIKVSPSGQETYYRDLINSAYTGSATTINLFKNDSLFITSTWSDSINGNVGVYKTDTLGNITTTRTVSQNEQFGFSSSLITYDTLFLASGTFQGTSTRVVKLFKFTRDLNDAPIDTQPRVYDSLCPHQIVSDTTNLDDCAIITKVDDPFRNPEKFNLTLFPNPASNIVTILIPERIVKNTSAGTTQIATIFHQWNSAKLEINDLSGNQIWSQEINQKTARVELNVSAWSPGMYLARLIFRDETVGKAMLVVK